MDQKLATECVAAADALLDRRLWQRFENEHLVLLARDLCLRCSCRERNTERTSSRVSSVEIEAQQAARPG